MNRRPFNVFGKIGVVQKGSEKNLRHCVKTNNAFGFLHER